VKNIGLLLEIFPSLPAHWYLYLWNFYPPFFGAGIRIHHVAPDFSSARTSLRLRWWNRNIIGTLFGGSLYSMCDPMHMVLLSHLLGPDYVVRDRGAEVRFLRKGVNSAHAHFEISTRTVAEIWNDPSEVQERKFKVEVRDREGDVIAEVVKTLYIRRKGAATK
jgi:acyl-coenzyme A thioesterase PaaI-like protein